MSAAPLPELAAISLERDGTMSVQFEDGRSETTSLGQQVFAATSMIESSTYLAQSSRLRSCTTRGDDIVRDLPVPTNLAPLHGYPTNVQRSRALHRALTDRALPRSAGPRRMDREVRAACHRGRRPRRDRDCRSDDVE